jgi:hypothetical protein
MGSGESDTEDLANWLRDMGEGVSEDPFDSSIDASWLGAAPTAEDAYGNPIAGSGNGSGNGTEAGAGDGAGDGTAAPEPGAAEAGA